MEVKNNDFYVEKRIFQNFLDFSRVGPVGWKSKKDDFYVMSAILVVLPRKIRNFEEMTKKRKRRSSEISRAGTETQPTSVSYYSTQMKKF